MSGWMTKKEAAAVVEELRPPALPTALARIFSAVLHATVHPLLSAAIHPAQALVSNTEALEVFETAQGFLRRSPRNTQTCVVLILSLIHI